MINGVGQSKIQNQAMTAFNLIIIVWSPSFIEENQITMNEFKLVDELQQSLI